MRQHAIPQNILDVEFKIFTKFTLKEFAYLGIGVGIGGVFLYFTTKGMFPGIVGIPLFILFAGIGVFFALVPINDQPADKFISNFFYAVNRPTQRVWLNKELKEERIKPAVVPKKEKQKVFGGAKIDETGQRVYTDNPKEEQPMQETGKNETSLPVEDIQEKIIINEENISKYQFNIKSIDKLLGNINLWICTKDNKPVPDIQVYLKDKEGKLLYANKTGGNGYFLTNKEYPEGIYNIEFERVSYNIQPIQIVLTKNMGKLPYRIEII